MNKAKMFVGNLSFDETEEALRFAFAPFGTVERVRIETHRQSGQFKGFGFVEMSHEEDGERAVHGLNGKERNGRKLTVASVGPYHPKNGGPGAKPRY